jgi:hypothetical protein
MNETDRFIVYPRHLYRTSFVSVNKNQPMSSIEGHEAKSQMDAANYSGDIKDYITKI